MPRQIQFAVDFVNYSPEIALASGYILAEWGMIEESVTRLLRTFQMHDLNRRHVPRKFDLVWDELNLYVKNLYGAQPAEWAEYHRVAAQLKDIKGKRDSVAHGVQCVCTLRGKSYAALWMPNWVAKGKPQGIPADFRILKSFAERASVLKQEWFWVERTVQWAFLRPIQEAQSIPSLRGTQQLPPAESLLANPLRNPTPTKSPPRFASPLRWPVSTSDWQRTWPDKEPKFASLQMVTAILLEDVLLGPPPESSRA